MKLAWELTALFLLLLGPQHLEAAEVDVASSQGLAEALAMAAPGTTIRLAPGNYGRLTLRDLAGGPDAPIVISSADPARPASLSEVSIHGAAHLELRDLLLDYTFTPGDPDYYRPFSIEGSQDVSLTRVVVDGDDAHGTSSISDGFPHALGLFVRGVEGFELENSVVTGFKRGMEMSRSIDILIKDNDFHSLRMDGMDFAQVRRVLIEGNWIHDFDRAVDSEDHPDMIQFWTERTDIPSADVTIRGNLLVSGAGAWTQSIFMRNELVDTGRASFADMAYRNIRIEGNVIINAHINGIVVGPTDGLVIANNAVLRNAFSQGRDDNPDLWTPQIKVNPEARDVTIRGNVTAAVAGLDGQQTWQVEANLLVQDRAPSRPGYYARVFAGMPQGDPRDPTSFAPRLGGPLDGTGIGPSWLGQQQP